MADKTKKWPQNIPGKFFVDDSCISCDACVTTAPKHFAMDEDEGHAFLKAQPTNSDEEAACKEAMDGCPVEAIGNDGEGTGN